MLIAFLLALLIGVSLGLLGGGGSIITVPVLVYVVGLPAKEAIATSLLVVGVTAAAATWQHARAGNVRWRTGFAFSAAAAGGAYAGGLTADLFSGTVLLLIFAALMIVTAVAMLRGRKDTEAPIPGSAAPLAQRFVTILLEGSVVGFITGLVGAGGGFLVVPALVLLGRVPMREAVGTSLLVIAIKSFAAFAGHVGHVPIDYALAGVVTGAAVLGSLGGAQLARRIDPTVLRQAFAVFVLVMAAYVVIAESGPALRPVIGIAAALALGGTGVWLRRRSAGRSSTVASRI
jgi:uncharacterized membrane protein YfcA